MTTVTHITHINKDTDIILQKNKMEILESKSITILELKSIKNQNFKFISRAQKADWR